jgi:hypothetical protein
MLPVDGIDIVIEMYEEDLPLSVYIEGTVYEEDEELYNQLIHDLDTGKYLYTTVMVSAYFQGRKIAYDCLGCCIYKDLDDFIENSGYYEGMVNTVVTEGKQEMRRLYDNLTIYFRKRGITW